MNGAESQSLIEARPLDLLEVAEAEALSKHLEGCAPCSTQAAELDRVYDRLGELAEERAKDAQVSRGVRDALLAAIAAEGPPSLAEDQAKKTKGTLPPEPTKDAQALGIRVKRECLYCHAPTERSEVAFCATCLAPHHVECFRAHGRCAVLGCEETLTVRPGEPVAPGAEPTSSAGRRAGLVISLVAALGGVTVAAYTGAFRRPAAPEVLNVPWVSTRDQEIEADLLRTKTADHLKALHDAVRAGDAPQARTRLGTIDSLTANARASQEGPLRIAGQEILRQAVTEYGYWERTLSIDAHDVPLAEVCLRFGQDVGVNVVVDPDVEAVVRLRLEEIPWPQALEVLARHTGCRIESPGGEMLVLTKPRRVSQQFTDANVRTVLQLLARKAGKDLTISPEVAGNVTLEFKDVPWDTALFSVVNMLGDFEILENDEGMVLVTTRSALEERVFPGFRPLSPGVDWSPPEWAPPELLERRKGAVRVSIDVEEQPLEAVVADLRKQTGRTLSVAEGIRETVSVELEDKPWPLALQVLAGMTGTTLEERGEALVFAKPPRITLQGRDMNARYVLRSIAEEANINLMLSPMVWGKVSLDLESVHWRTALLAVAEGAGSYAIWKVGNLYQVRPTAEPVPRGGEPFQRATPWVPDRGDVPRVTIDSSPRTVAQFCELISEQAERNVIFQQEALGLSVHEIELSDVPWTEAVRRVAERTGHRVTFPAPDGAVLSTPDVEARAYECPVGPWATFLGRLQGESVVVGRGPGAMRLSAQSEGVGFLRLLRDWARKGDCSLEERGSVRVLRLANRRGPRPQRTPDEHPFEVPAGLKVFGKAGRLQAVARVEDVTAAVIGGEPYAPGARLKNEATGKLILVRLVRVDVEGNRVLLREEGSEVEAWLTATPDRCRLEPAEKD